MKSTRKITYKTVLLTSLSSFRTLYCLCVFIQFELFVVCFIPLGLQFYFYWKCLLRNSQFSLCELISLIFIFSIGYCIILWF